MHEVVWIDKLFIKQNFYFFKMIGKELDVYIEQMQGGIPLFIGHEAFDDLYQRGRIKPDSHIRVRAYGQVIDPHYKVTEKGELEDIADIDQEENQNIFNPQKILSFKNAPNGWEVEGKIWPETENAT